MIQFGRIAGRGGLTVDKRVFVLNVIGMEYARGSVLSTHVHEDYSQLFYVCGGEVSYLYDGKIVSLRAGDFLLIPPRVTHGMLPTTGERLVVLDIKFRMDDHDFSSELLRFGMVTKSCSEEVQGLFRIMFRVAQDKNAFYLDILSDLLSAALCLHISEKTEKNEREVMGMEKYARLSECTKKVLRFIEGGVVTCDFSSLDVIAANLGYNKEYMSRTFSQEIGMSITRYLQTLRIDKAKELLLSTDYDINHISRLLSYRDVTHFIRTFKRYLGTTPEKFRRTAERENALRYSFRIHDVHRDG